MSGSVSAGLRGNRRSRAAGAIELALGFAYFLLMEAVLKDWLTSYAYPDYPLLASFVTSTGVIAGFIALRRVRRPGVWRDIVLAGSAALTAAEILGFLPNGFGVLPSVAVLTCGLAIAPLAVRGGRSSVWRKRLYVAAAAVGFAAMTWRRINLPRNTAWGSFVVLVTFGVSVLVVLILQRPKGRGQGYRIIRSGLAGFPIVYLLAGGLFSLFLITLSPLALLSFNNTGLLGLGLGLGRPSASAIKATDFIAAATWKFSLPAVIVTACALIIPFLLVRKQYISRLSRGLYAVAATAGFAALYYASVTLPGPLPVQASRQAASGETMPFAMALANEQGLFTVFALGLVLLAGLCGGAIVMSGPLEGEDREERITLLAGAVAGLYGMLMGAHIGPPFLTSDSAAGTWALSIAAASLGIAAFPLARPQAPAEFTVKDGRAWKERKTVVLAALLGTGLIALALVSLVVYYQPILQKMVQPYTGTTPLPGYKAYVPLSEISREMKDATVAFEDPEFYSHGGFDWQSIYHALRVNLRTGRVQRGGSTITQQLAKNLFLTKERTLRRKIEEAALAAVTERLLTKERILEIYLNTIDYGMGQKGIEAAARYYFHKAPRRLTLAESAVLVGLVPNPPARHLSLRQATAGQRAALQGVIHRWPGRYSDADREEASRIPMDKLIYLEKDALDLGAADQPSAAEQQGVSRLRGRASTGIAAALFICAVILVVAVHRLKGRYRSSETEPSRPTFDSRLLSGIAYFSVLTILAAAWYGAGWESALYTSIYPYDALPAGMDISSFASHIDRTERLISELDKEVAPIAFDFINYLRFQGLPVVIAEGRRSLIKQGILYAQGRLSPGPVVTETFLGGKHLNGTAFDIGFAGITYSAFGSKDWEIVGEIGEAFGLRWGGRFENFKDFVHFEIGNSNPVSNCCTVSHLSRARMLFAKLQSLQSASAQADSLKEKGLQLTLQPLNKRP